MIVYLDNIIFSLQPSGCECSRQWAIMIRHLLPIPDVKLRFIEYRNACDNDERSLLDLARRGHLYFMRNLWLTRYLAVRIDGYDGKPFIFHSSGYRICDNPWAVNIITVNDDFKPTYHRLMSLRRCDLITCTSRQVLSLLPADCKHKATIVSTKKSNKNIALFNLKAYRMAIRRHGNK